MRNLLAGTSTLLILFGVLGACRSWYTVGGLPAETGKFAFRVEVDALKVGTDVTDTLRWIHSKVSRPSEEETVKEEKAVKDEVKDKDKKDAK